MAPIRQHVLFNMSAAVSLRQALGDLGRPDEVIALGDDLSFGPIDPPEPQLRARWVDAQLGYDWSQVGAESQAFWCAALEPRSERTAWVSRRSPREYAGFLEFLWRLGDAPCDVVDLTEAQVADWKPGGAPALSRPIDNFGLLPAYQIIESDLLGRAKPLGADLRQAFRQMWRGLRTDNAPLRVLTAEGALSSAAMTVFDAQLLRRATRDWRPTAQVVNQAIGGLDGDYHRGVSDLIIFARVWGLVQAGRLEERWTHAGGEIRLPRTEHLTEQHVFDAGA